MPQWRKLHTKSVESLDIHDMPDDFHRLLWLMLPLVLDRRGRGMDSGAWLRSKAMPLRDDVTNEMTADALNWYAEHGMIERYEVEGRAYFWVPTWHNHQGDTGREAESLYPAPPEYFDPYAKDKGEETSDESDAQGESESGVGHEQVVSKSCLDSDANADANTDSEAEEPPSAAPRSPPKRPKHRRQPTPTQEASRAMFAALAKACQIDLALLTDAQRGQLNQTEKRLRAEGIIPLDLSEFTTWWYAHDWRGKKKEPPKPAQVREEWGKFTAYRNGGQHGTVEIASGLGERA